MQSQKKRSSKKFFRRSPQKNVFQKIFQPLHKILTIQKIVLFSSRGQANFWGLEVSRTSKCVKDVVEDSTSDNCYPSGWHRCPNPNCNAKFWSKRKIALCIFFPISKYCIYTVYTSIPHVRNPSATRTPLWWLEGERVNHYTTPIATMQWQNAVSKPNVWEKGNGGLLLIAAACVTFAWLASTVYLREASHAEVTQAAAKPLTIRMQITPLQRCSKRLKKIHSNNVLKQIWQRYGFF